MILVVRLLLLLVFCVSCMQHHKDIGNKSQAPVKSFYFSQISAIPINYDISYFITFYNWSDHNLNLSDQDFHLNNLELKKGSTLKDIIDASHCTHLLPHSSCDIKLNIYNQLSNTDGSFSLSVSKEDINAITLIKYFASNNDLDFDKQLDSNDTSFSLSRVQPMSVSIPIVFNQDYYDVEVSHDTQVSTKFLKCDVKHFMKNQVCVLQISSEGGRKFSSLVKVTAKKAENNAGREEILRAPIVNIMNNFGNLLIGLSSNTITANGSSYIMVTLANNGLGSISNITPSFVNSGTPLYFTANSCGSGIAANGYCTMAFFASNSTIWSVDGVKIQYSDGLNNLAITAPVIIKPNSGAYGALNLSTSGALTNTTIYNSSAVTVTVSNTGTLAVSNITVTASLPNSITQTQNTCTSTLAAGSSCQYVYTYTPTAVTSLSGFNFVINGQYSFASSPATISNAANIQYSSVDALSYLYVQDGSYLYSYRMNPGYSFTSAGAAITSSGSSTSVVYGGRLLLFNSTGTITTYPINGDGSLATAVTVTVNSAFNAVPSAAIVNLYNGYLYVSTFNGSSMITTYKCSSITAQNTISCSSYSVGPYIYTGRISSVAYGYNSTLLYATSGMAQMLYTTNDGQSLSATGPSTGGLAGLTADNLSSDMTLVYSTYGYLYSVGYNSNGTVNSGATQLPISVSGSVSQLFLEGVGHSGYTFSKPLLFVLFSNNSLKMTTLDGTYSSSPVSSTVLNFAINAQ